MSWIHWLLWPIIIIIGVKGIRFGWKNSQVVEAAVKKAGDKGVVVRPLLPHEKKAVLYGAKTRQRRVQMLRDPETLTTEDLDELDNMFEDSEQLGRTARRAGVQVRRRG